MTESTVGNLRLLYAIGDMLSLVESDILTDSAKDIGLFIMRTLNDVFEENKIKK